MKKCCFLITMAIVGIQCGQFPTRYERIEPDALRSIGFVYTPYAEGAPGDTIRVGAYFAGEKVVSVSWQMSYNHIVNPVSRTETVVDITDLLVFDVVSQLPDSVSISFVVPDSALFLTKAITSQALDLLRSQLPQSMRSMTQQDLAALLKDLGKVNFNDPLSVTAFAGTWGPLMGITTLTGSALDSVEIISGKIVGAFSISGILYANAVSDQGKRLKIKGDFTIRYNRHFQNSPLAGLLPVNHNPTQRWIGVYKVLGKNVQLFQPGDPKFAGKFSLTYLYNERYPDSVNDMVLIDTGYTYFLGADSGIVTYALKAGDTMTIGDSLHVFANDTILHDTSLDRNVYEFETWYYDWQYENLDLDSVTEPLDSLFVIAGVGQGGGQPPIVQMLPSLDTKLTHARIWVTVYDELLGELNRPVGFAIKNVDVYFKYTDAYKKAHL